MKKDNELLGTVVGLINAGTEKADTRNWQTLPHSIYYCRVPMPVGHSTIKLTLTSVHGESTVHEFSYDIKKGQTFFHTFSSLDSSFPNYN